MYRNIRYLEEYSYLKVIKSHLDIKKRAHVSFKIYNMQYKNQSEEGVICSLNSHQSTVDYG